MTRSLITLLAAAALAGCDGDGGTGPGGPNLVGNYETTYTIDVRGAGFSETVSCAGTISITEQDDDEFSGGFAVRDSENCEAGSGTIRGTVEEDGEVRLEMESPGGEDPVEDLTGMCTQVGGSDRLEGTFSNGRILADAELTVDCSTEFGDFQFEATLGVDAQKG